MNIEKQMLTVNPFSRPGQKLQEVKGVVIHWVANPGTSAQANRNYFESLKRQKKKRSQIRFSTFYHRHYRRCTAMFTD
ncbi:hypothetical protein [Treponema phagedenis]|uniref:hypothetical protein n=1 Tax=Treponema phagedenis TaxID=162 RepID=UPI0021CC7689|nr:hypothetical protein [Treponema phagedenis]